ncbi:MAG: hypothetical protein MJ092_03025 [Lachnospiraceae bacterium]|nr:hypothetical protein [Lachnospiraceae bacterium]
MIQWLEKNKIQNKLFSVVWSIFLLTGFFWLTEWFIFDETGTCETIWWVLEYIIVIVSAGIILLNFICRKYSWKVILAYGIVGVIVLLSTYFSKDYNFIPVFLILGAAYQQNSKRVITISALLTAVFLLIMLICSQTGLVENTLFWRFDGTAPRQSLGLVYASTAPSIYLGFILQYVYLRKQNLRIWEFAILEAVNVFYFWATDSRVPFYLGTAVVLFFFIENLFRNHWRFTKHLKWLTIIAPGLIAAGTVIVYFLYDVNSKFWGTIDRFLSCRIWYGREALDTYGIKLFGQDISWIGYGSGAPEGTYNYVDCSYMQILLQFGVLLLAAIVFLYMVGIYRGAKRGDYWMVCILLIICAFALMEPYLLNLISMPLPILAVLALDSQSEPIKFDENWLKNAINAE